MHEHRRAAVLEHGAPGPLLQATIIVAAACIACIAFVTALTSGIVRYPGWLAIQHASLVLAPALAGAYWWRARPASRLGPLLVAFALLSTLITFQTASNPYLFSLGVAVDGPAFAMTLYILLAFPMGRLRGPADRAIVALTALTVSCTFVPSLFLAPRLAAAAPTSACRELCPQNGWLLTDRPGLVSALTSIESYATIAVTIATAAVLASRYVRGNPPQRRALTAGVSVGLLFCLSYAAFHLLLLIAPDHAQLRPVLSWTLAVARAAFPWGMLVALATAELYGGQLLARLVASVGQRPGIPELEQTLASALHDPELRLAFWDPLRTTYLDAAGVELAPPEHGSGRTLTEVGRDGERAVAILHDEQLREGPELVKAAGAAALLAFENARLEDSLGDLIADLRRSRARLAAVGITERRRLERDLHDGAQQQFIVFRMKLSRLTDEAADDAVRRRLGELDADLELALESLRELALGIYPALLTDGGLAPALEAIGDRSSISLTVSANIGRYPIEIESALYYCALEAIQNATKHAGPQASLVVFLDEADEVLLMTVRDRGCGFEQSTALPGGGLRNMHDRIGSVGGDLAIDAVPGRGTIVRARVPIDHNRRAITSHG